MRDVHRRTSNLFPAFAGVLHAPLPQPQQVLAPVGRDPQRDQQAVGLGGGAQSICTTRRSSAPSGRERLSRSVRCESATKHRDTALREVLRSWHSWWRKSAVASGTRSSKGGEVLPRQAPLRQDLYVRSGIQGDDGGHSVDSVNQRKGQTMSDPIRELSESGWIAEHRKLYLEDGVAGHMWDSTVGGGPGPLPTLLLFTTGRKSGQADPATSSAQNVASG